jgi:AP-1 complex subunit gamma-1
MSIKLRELIRSIRACKTAAEERAVIARECALIRTAFKEDDNQFRHRNVAKLLFIHMMGYPTHFGQMECLKLIASPKFPEKRVGYLGLTQLLDENTEVLMLVTNSIKNDLGHENQYVNGLALCALGNIASPEMCRALAREVERMMDGRDARAGGPNPYIKKKAALCAMRIIRKVDEIEDKFNKCIGPLLEDRNHGVLISGCCLLTALLELNPSYVSDFRRHIPSLVKVLRNMVTSGYPNAAEYDIAGITDPFLQAKILRLLRILGTRSVSASDDMNDILAQVATNTEGTKNTGNAILYECVLTIMSIEAESGLRVLGINILGRFLLSRDNNIRYVALATLQRVVNVDLKAVGRHKATIIECLKDPDISIRKRALDVAYALVNEDNIKKMTKELLNYLLVADTDFKEELCSRICMAVDKYSPDRRWQIDTLIKVMCLGGNFVKEQQREKFCRVVAATPELHSYTVIKLYFNMKESQTQEALVHVGVWCLGEFGDHLVSGRAVGPDNQPIHVLPADVLDLLQDIIRKPPNPEKAHQTHAFVAAALVKLVTRCPGEAICCVAIT